MTIPKFQNFTYSKQVFPINSTENTISEWTGSELENFLINSIKITIFKSIDSELKSLFDKQFQN